MVVNHAVESTLANWAEIWYAVGSHAAVDSRAVDALALITTTLIDTNGCYVVLVEFCNIFWLCRYGCTSRQHVCPFPFEVGKGGEVFVPWFYVGVIILCVGVIIEVFVAQATKFMRKLMHGDGYGIDVVGSGDAVAVVDSAAAIGVGIGQNGECVRNPRRQAGRWLYAGLARRGGDPYTES